MSGISAVMFLKKGESKTKLGILLEETLWNRSGCGEGCRSCHLRGGDRDVACVAK